MPKPNYGFQKRQKELAKQQKRADKLERRLARKDEESGADSEAAASNTDPSQDSNQELA